MNKTAIFYIISIAFLMFIASCSSFKFSKTGVFVNDVDEYFNPALQVNVWTYMNFYPYQNGGETGVRLNEFYAQDKEILKKIGLKGRGANVLFSAVPNIVPYYNLLAILHTKKLPKTSGFEKIDVGNDQYYLQKDFELGRLDIRHVLIPFEKNKKMLSLIYYISSEQHLSCKFCKLDYLAKINAMNLQDSAIHYRNNWFIADNVSDKAIDLQIQIPHIIIKEKERIFLKLFAQYESETGINYFHILEPSKNSNEIKLKLLPNRYYLEYSNEKNQVIHRDTIQVKS